MKYCLEPLEPRWMLAGDISIVKSTKGSIDPSFVFSGTGPEGFNFSSGFSLDSNFDDTSFPSVREFEGLPAGTYTITEAAATGFKLSRISCPDPDGGTSVDLDSRTVTIDLDDGESINCIFFNTEESLQQDQLVIDDFNTPQGPFTLTSSGSLDSTVTGDMLGGTRFMDLFLSTTVSGTDAAVGVSGGSYDVAFNNQAGNVAATGVIYRAPTGQSFDFSGFDRFELDFVTPPPGTSLAPGALNASIFGVTNGTNSDALTIPVPSNSDGLSVPLGNFPSGFDFSDVNEIGFSFVTFEPGSHIIAVDRFSAAGGTSAVPVDTTFPFLAELDLEADAFLPLGPNDATVKTRIEFSGLGSGLIDPVQEAETLEKGDTVDFTATADLFYDVTFQDVDPDADFGDGLGSSFTLPNLFSTLSTTQSGIVDTTRPNLGLASQLSGLDWERDSPIAFPNGRTVVIPDTDLIASFLSQVESVPETTENEFSAGAVSSWSGASGSGLPPFYVATQGSLTITETQIRPPIPMLTGPSTRDVKENTSFIVNDVIVMERFDPDRIIRVAVTPFNTSTQTFIGTTTLGSIAGLTFLDGDGTDDQNVFFEGTVNDVNAALSGLQVNLGGLQSGDNVLNVVISDASQTFVNFIEINLNVQQSVPLTSNFDVAEGNEDDGPITINVLANDQVFTPPNTPPTISAINGTTANPGQTVSTPSGAVLSHDGSTFTYLPPPDFFGTDTFTYTITNGQTAEDSAAVAITVQPINDGPINSIPGTQVIDEDNDLVFSGGPLTISDVDADPVFVGLQSGGGTLTVPPTSGVTITNLGANNLSLEGGVSDVNNALSGLKYEPNVDFNGSDRLHMITSDLGNSGTGGPLVDTDTINITINPVNDAPINTVPGPQTLFNTDTLSFNTGDFQVLDVDASTLEVMLDVGQGTLGLNASGLQVEGNNSSSLTARGSVADLNSGLGSLLYDPTGSFIGTDTLTMTTSDGTLSDVDTVNINVAPPQVPFAASDFFQIEEDPTSALSFSLSQLLSNDVAPGVPLANSLNLTQINQLPSSTGPFSTPGGSLSFDDNSGTFTYTPVPNFFGLDTFTYTIESSPDPGDGPSDGTVTIEIQPINDGPLNTVPGTVTVNEDNDLVFSGVNLITVDDLDAGDDDLTVMLSVDNGTLNIPSTDINVSNNGSGTVSLDGTVSQINSALGGLTYVPPKDFFGTDQLIIETNDNGNAGGVPGNPTAIQALSDTDTVNITVQPINDPPVLVVPGKQSFFTDFDNRFSSDPPFSVSDVDAGDNDVQVDLTIGDGTLSLSSTSGVTVTQNPGASNGIRIVGPISDINNVLSSGVDYQTAFSGDKSLMVVVNDLGNTGDAPLSADAAVEIEVLDFVPIDIVGQVFVDEDADGREPGEPGIEGVDITLNGSDFQGNTIDLSTTTDSIGSYTFVGLRPNSPGQPYMISQVQPAFIQNHQQASDQAIVEFDPLGNVVVNSGSLDFGEAGFEPSFADLLDFADAKADPANSGILFGAPGNVQDWSIFFGEGWDTGRYSTPRLVPSDDGLSAVLTVFDSQAGEDRTANVSTQDGTLNFRGQGSDRVYRVIGGAELLSDVVAPPRVQSVQINDGSTTLPAAQKGASKIKSILITFDQIVGFSGPVVDAFQLVNDTTNETVGSFQATSDSASGQTIVTITNFMGPSVEGQSLADGSYTLTTLSGQVAADGQALDGNRDGDPGSDAVDMVMRRFGDEDGDGIVDQADIEAGIALALGTSIADDNYDQRFDVDDDGVITFHDYFELHRRRAK